MKKSKFKSTSPNLDYNNQKSISSRNHKYNTLDTNTNYNFNNLFFKNNNNSQRLIFPTPPFLPPKRSKSSKSHTLILDLDETLLRFEINENNPYNDNVIFRPGLFYFLNKVYPLFEIVIWTVATKEYADPIIDIIEEKKKYFVARLFREHATIRNNTYIKDLSNLGRDISKIIIVDDKEISFSLQKENGILIKPFYGSYAEVKSDLVLYDLFKILIKIILDKSNDVRKGIINYQYEIKLKISQIYSKVNARNDEKEKNNFIAEGNIFIKDFKNNPLIRSNNNNSNKRNYYNRKINKSNSMSDMINYN